MRHTIPEFAPLKQPTAFSGLRFQVSYKAIIAVLFVTAFIVGSVMVPPFFAVLSCFFTVTLTALIIATLFFARGWARAFASGYLIPHAAGYLALLDNLHGPEDILIPFFLSNLVGLVVGTITACAHGFFKRRGGHLPVPKLPFIRNWFSN